MKLELSKMKKTKQPKSRIRWPLQAGVSSMAQGVKERSQAASPVVRMDTDPMSVTIILTKTSSVTTVERKDT
jgi:hypothetical protein